MMSQYRHPMAIFVGGICAIAAVILLFGDVRWSHLREDLSVEHFYVIMGLTVAVTAGHYMRESFSDGMSGVPAGLLLGGIFIAATVVCVAFAGGRGAAYLEQNERSEALLENSMKSQASTVLTLKGRVEEADATATAARNKLTTLTDAYAAQCGTGKGSKCEGSKLGVEAQRLVADDATKRYDAAKEEYDTERKALKDMKPKISNVSIKQFAADWGAFLGLDGTALYHRIKGIVPYVMTVVIEFAGILFLNVGFKKKAPTFAESRIGTQSLSDIAKSIGMDPRLARKHTRALGIERPAAGWVFKGEEARDVKTKLLMKL